MSDSDNFATMDDSAWVSLAACAMVGSDTLNAGPCTLQTRNSWVGGGCARRLAFHVSRKLYCMICKRLLRRRCCRC
jgi:hypothetical protein